MAIVKLEFKKNKNKKKREKEDADYQYQEREMRHHYKSMNIKKIIKEYYKQLYAHTFDNLDNMGKYFEMCTLPKLT